MVGACDCCKLKEGAVDCARGCDTGCSRSQRHWQPRCTTQPRVFPSCLKSGGVGVLVLWIQPHIVEVIVVVVLEPSIVHEIPRCSGRGAGGSRRRWPHSGGAIPKIVFPARILRHAVVHIADMPAPQVVKEFVEAQPGEDVEAELCLRRAKLFHLEKRVGRESVERCTAARAQKHWQDPVCAA